MRFAQSKALLGFAALAVAFAFATPAVAQNKCSSGKVKCVDKKQKCKLGCHSKAEGKGEAVDPLCLQKCEDKFDGGADPAKGCFEKLEGKQDPAKPESICPTENDTAAEEAKIDAFVLDVVQELDPGFPTPVLNKCSAGKKKCVLKKVSAKLKCEANNLKKPDAVKYAACIQKAEDKFDGGADPTKGCFAKLEAKPPCLTTGDTAAMEAKVDAFVLDVVDELTSVGPTPTPTSTPGAPTTTATSTPGGGCGNGMVDPGEDCDPPGSTAACLALNAGNGNEVCSATCTCPCPNIVAFQPSATSANSELDAGWTGISHDSKIISNGDISVDITACPSSPDNSRPCGTCNFTGPIPNPNAGAGRLNSRRCRNDSSVTCTSNANCPGAGNACVFWFGAPLPLSAGGVTTCVTNEVNGTITGTANVESGESASSANLTSRVYNGILLAQPCPQCSDAGGINDSVTGGTCIGGARNGLACDAHGESPVPSFGRTSLDCPPTAGGQIASLPIALKNSTDPESRSLSANSPFCTAFGSTSQKCPCDTCNNAAATPCASNADCTAVGATICGGLRCLADSAGATGSPCTSEGENQDPACGQVAPGACPAGTCVGGPTPGATCTLDDDCGGTCGRAGEPTKPNACSNGQCVSGGGTDDGQCQVNPTDSLCTIEPFRGCTANSDCPALGDTCGTKRRECLFNLDDLPVTNTGTITVNGMENAPMNDDSTPILASLFCIGPTSASAVNAVAGLPGLGKLRLTGTAEGLP